MNRIARRKVGFVKDFAVSFAHGIIDAQRFRNVRAFCLFLGYPRSGHSLVGSLLDAHRRAVIAHEQDILKYVELGFRRFQLLTLLHGNARGFARKGRVWTGYSYKVPGQWQGRAELVEVIGDKQGGRTLRRLDRRPELMDGLLSMIRVPVTVVHVVRNPFDNIATRYLKAAPKRDLPATINIALKMYDAMARLKQRWASDDRVQIIDVHHEQLLEDPELVLNRICEGFGLTASPTYVAACAQILFSRPRQTRHRIAWPATERRRVESAIDRHHFLARYTFRD